MSSVRARRNAGGGKCVRFKRGKIRGRDDTPHGSLLIERGVLPGVLGGHEYPSSEQDVGALLEVSASVLPAGLPELPTDLGHHAGGSLQPASRT